MIPLVLMLPLILAVKAAPTPESNSLAFTSQSTLDNYANNNNNFRKIPIENTNKLSTQNTKEYNTKNNNNNNSNNNISMKLKKIDQEKMTNIVKTKATRYHKAFVSGYPHSDKSHEGNYKDIIEERRLGNRKNNNQDSKIFYVRLPPSPYYYVPGLGYISNPPKILPSSLKPYQLNKHHINNVINLPLDFISNGKPTAVYQWTNKPKKSKPSKKPGSSVMTKLKKGPYGFNGKPVSLYLLGLNGETKMHQPIRYSDVKGNSLY